MATLETELLLAQQHALLDNLRDAEVEIGRLRHQISILKMLPAMAFAVADEMGLTNDQKQGRGIWP